MRSLFIMPSEVISHILCFLSPRDVVRLRVISKQFHDLSYDRALWRTLYRNARLPRPPGPFLSQSIQFFEHTRTIRTVNRLLDDSAHGSRLGCGDPTSRISITSFHHRGRELALRLR
ncbi:hypothetical protein EV363DRAFT_1356662 [Boletus edulis]|nr:hypothetical protein EV363DRAFT_1356662 [Boletus edulis]